LARIDGRVRLLASAPSDGVELFSPFWSLICVVVQPKSENDDWNDAEQVNVDSGPDLSIPTGDLSFRFSYLMAAFQHFILSCTDSGFSVNKSIGNSFQRKDWTDDLDPGPTIADKHRVCHLQSELRTIL